MADLRSKTRPTFILTTTLLLTSLAWAGEPIHFSPTGTPYKWDNSSPIPFNPDISNLGYLTNDEAIRLVEEALQMWSGAPAVSLTFDNAGPTTDATGAPLNIFWRNFGRITGKREPNGQNPIAFDEDGRIFSTLFGENSGVLGFASPQFMTEEAPYFITEGFVFLNGAYVDSLEFNGEISLGILKAVAVHEFGHFLNLAHSQVNGFAALFSREDVQGFGVPPMSSIETMYPFIADASQVTPHADDVSILSLLYGADGRGAISGRIFLQDGITPVTGINVVARNLGGGRASVFEDAVAQISGAPVHFRDNLGSRDAIFEGSYSLSGLTPGGDYSVEIKQIGPGGYSSPVQENLAGPEEFYNGDNESADPVTDPRAEIITLTPAAGVAIENVDIILNNELPPILLEKYDGAVELALALSRPNGPTDFFAVRHSIPACVGSPYTISNVRFYNNDSGTLWPRVILTTANEQDQPDLEHPFAVFRNRFGVPSQFINIEAGIERTSLEDIFIVLQLPPGDSLTAIGAGGGPGIGVDLDRSEGFIPGNLFSRNGIDFEEIKLFNLAVDLTLNGTLSPDRFEPNNDAASPAVVALDTLLKGYLDPPGELDFFAFQGDRGDLVRLDVNAATLGSKLDGILYLLSSSGEVIAVNNNEPGDFFSRDPLLEVELPETGTYLIRLDSFEHDLEGIEAGGPQFFYELALRKIVTFPRLTHDTGRVKFDVWSNGIYGDDGSTSGRGFRFLENETSALFAGGFLAATVTNIAANNPSLIVGTQPWIDFQEASPLNLFGPAAGFDQVTTCAFNEGISNNFTAPIGISVTQTSYSNSGANFVLLECQVTNVSNEAINDLYLGQFADWDIGSDNFELNRGGYDEARSLAYQNEHGDAPNDSNWYGVSALSGASGSRVTTEQSVDSLLNFISNFDGPGPQPITTDEDYRIYLGSGPFSIEPGQSQTVGFAWLAGESLEDLQAQADLAQAAWDDLVTAVQTTETASQPIEFRLLQNYPNPFNPTTRILYTVARSGPVELVIYNTLGQVVSTLVNQNQTADKYVVAWDGRDNAGLPVSSGVYFYSLRADGKQRARKMLLLR